LLSDVGGSGPPWGADNKGGGHGWPPTLSMVRSSAHFSIFYVFTFRPPTEACRRIVYLRLVTTFDISPYKNALFSALTKPAYYAVPHFATSNDIACSSLAIMQTAL